MMKRILFGCIGAGLAVGGAYFLYKRWQKNQQQCQQESNEQPTLRKSKDFIPSLDEGLAERVDLPICTVEPGEITSNEGERETTKVEEHVDKTAELQISNKESLQPENAFAEKDETGHEPTLRKSEDFIPSLDEGITETVDLPIGAVKPGENTSIEDETKRSSVEKNVDKTAELQISNKESLKPDNAFAWKDKTGHGVQHSQEFPLGVDGAWKDISNMAETGFPIFGAHLVKLPLEGTDYDENALYGSMNDFILASFASLLDSKRTTVDAGQNSENGPSSSATSPSTSEFHSNRDDQPSGAGSKKVNKESGRKRRRTRKHKKK